MSFISVSGLPCNGVGLVAALRRNYTNKNKEAAQKSAENGEFISPSLSLPPSPLLFLSCPAYVADTKEGNRSIP